MTENAARLVEGYFTEWLRHDDTGKKQVAEFGFDGAMDALFELLNAGSQVICDLYGGNRHAMRNVAGLALF